jgi:hypothetical protein
LIPKFGQDYLDYMRDVPKRYFSKRETMILLLVIGFGIVGAIM